MARKIEPTDKIGEDLAKIYGNKDPNMHVDHFFVRVGHEITQEMPSVLDVADPNLLGELKDWPQVEDWPAGFFYGRYDKKDHEKEREREKRLDEHVISSVKDVLQKQADFKGKTFTPHVIFHRACVYSDYELDAQVTKDAIKAILDKDYNSDKHNPDQHLDFFYISVRRQESAELDIFSKLQTLPGIWKKVKPQETWPDTFFGYFPKENILETEREREKRLNRQVRIPLKDHLEQAGANDSVHVLLTRACTLT